ISYKPRGGEVGMPTSGADGADYVMMARDSITRTGARAPGVERLGPLARRRLPAHQPCLRLGRTPDRSEGPGGRAVGPARTEVPTRAPALTQSREYTVKAVGTKDEGKPGFGEGLV